MGIFVAINNFLADHLAFFLILLSVIVFSTVPLLIATIVHAYRGNGQRFPIYTSAFILLGYFCYLGYIFAYAIGDGQRMLGRSFYFGVLAVLAVSNWIFASTYFECALINPFTRSSQAEAFNLKVQKWMRVVFWTVVGIDILCCCYVFIPNVKVKVILFAFYSILLLLESVCMVVALYRMNDIIGAWRQGAANTKRMISHASAFILFVVALVYDEAMVVFDNKLYFFNWLITVLAFTVAMWLLVNLLWHLGTKERAAANDGEP